MKFHHATAIIGMASLVAACTKSAPSSVAVDQRKSDAVATTPVLQPFQNLGDFKGKPPDDLLKDAAIGQAIRAIVPQSRLKCLDEAMNYLPDMEIDSSGTAKSSLNGSEVDHMRADFFSVSPSGAINIVLQCDVPSDSKASQQLFTNEGVRAATSKATLDWLYGMMRPGEVIAKSDGHENVDIPYETFFADLLATAAKEHPANVAPPTPAPPAPIANVTEPAPTPLVGDWICQATASNGARYSSTYRFASDGSYVYAQPDFRATGTYQLGIGGASVTIDNISTGTLARDIRVVVTITAASPGHLQFESHVAPDGKPVENNCTPVKDASVQRNEQPVDKVAQYAESLAVALERNPHPACQAVASTIRSMARPGNPDYIRMRQIDSVFGHAPQMCAE
jgi:hypothetical protein